MGRHTVIRESTKIGASNISQRTEDKDQADAIKSTGCVFSKRGDAGSAGGSGESQNDEGQVICRGCDIRKC